MSNRWLERSFVATILAHQLLTAGPVVAAPQLQAEPIPGLPGPTLPTDSPIGTSELYLPITLKPEAPPVIEIISVSSVQGIYDAIDQIKNIQATEPRREFQIQLAEGTYDLAGRSVREEVLNPQTEVQYEATSHLSLPPNTSLIGAGHDSTTITVGTQQDIGIIARARSAYNPVILKGFSVSREDTDPNPESSFTERESMIRVIGEGDFQPQAVIEDLSLVNRVQIQDGRHVSGIQAHGVHTLSVRNSGIFNPSWDGVVSYRGQELELDGVQGYKTYEGHRGVEGAYAALIVRENALQPKLTINHSVSDGFVKIAYLLGASGVSSIYPSQITIDGLSIPDSLFSPNSYHIFNILGATVETSNGAGPEIDVNNLQMGSETRSHRIILAIPNTSAAFADSTLRYGDHPAHGKPPGLFEVEPMELSGHNSTLYLHDAPPDEAEITAAMQAGFDVVRDY